MPYRLSACLFILAICGAGVAAALQPAPAPCGSPPNQSVCLGEIDVPEAHRPAFANAARLAIDALHSDRFERELQAFIRDHAQSGDHAGRWRGVEAGATVAALRAALPRQRITTYGGVFAWLNHRFAGNLAYDGDEEGPIRVNRTALPRPAVEIANTIAHEVAHRIHLRHRKNGRSPEARCEPPYVIGSIVERISRGAEWQKSGGDCALLS
jgi:hypothetical protein